MKGLIGRKVGMTQIFDKNNKIIPVTIIKAGPCIVTNIRKEDKNGYSSLQLGFEDVKPKRLNNPTLGQFKKNNLNLCRILKEIKFQNIGNYKIGDEIKVDIFKEGEYADVTGITKGRGFTGVVKKWGFRGGPASHGSMIHRKPMSIGATDPARVFKGKKMPGHYGGEKATVQNLRIAKIDKENNLIGVIGSIPGANGGLVIIRKAKKM